MMITVDDALLNAQATPDSVPVLKSICEVFEFADGDIVVGDGDDAEWLGIILDGALVVSLPGGGKIRIPEGQVIGEIGYFSGRRRHGTITAEGSATLLMISYSAIDALSIESPKHVLPFIKGLASLSVARTIGHPDKTRGIALMAEKGRDDELIDFINANSDNLDGLTIMAPWTTASLMTGHCAVPCTKTCNSLETGGAFEIGHAIANGHIQAVVMLRNPLELDSAAHELASLQKLCDTLNVPYATNAQTGRMILKGLHESTVPA